MFKDIFQSTTKYFYKCAYITLFLRVVVKLLIYMFFCNFRFTSESILKTTGELIQTFPKFHGKAGVTYVCCHDNQVYSSGRDGMYRMFVWNEDNQLDLLHTNRVCKSFEWLEKLEFTEEEDIQIHGFYTNMFMIWSVRQNQMLLEIECGGGHRAWDYCCHGNSATFVYVKTREVKVTNIEMRSNQVIVKKCLHGRELCDSKHICSGIDSSGRPVNVMVTCIEDTSVCLSVLHRILALYNLLLLLYQIYIAPFS
ncbi:WD repeat-containing protein 6-like isoform X1 [Mercenaria mercenaria]|uniref:WD repeat-containing protein 6-like isoform X1 n=1 Tax=Mercenaria mercenaria TaxID=6596 RepID=UPI00234F9421|nr:WD repeat-containing protein 6-like isoform X1 [Mercenaria mercenaria]